MNDSELVQGLRCQDPAAMQWLCNCFLPSLWRFVYSRVNGDQHLAEDITSETILAMLTTLQSQNTGQPDAEIVNPGGWLRTVAARRITDHFRAVSRVQHLLQQSPIKEPDTAATDPVKRQELEEMRTEVRQTMDNLSDQYRLALEWKYIDKLSVQEIATRWDITEKAAESILFRARREFRVNFVQDSPVEPTSRTRQIRSLEMKSDDPLEPEDNAHRGNGHQDNGHKDNAHQDIAHKST